jgi:hypothetical protein
VVKRTFSQPCQDPKHQFFLRTRKRVYFGCDFQWGYFTKQKRKEKKAAK